MCPIFVDKCSFICFRFLSFNFLVFSLFPFLSILPLFFFLKEGNGSKKNGKRGSEMEIKKNTLMNFRSPNSFSQYKYERKWKAIIFRLLSPFISKERKNERNWWQKIEDEAKRRKKRKMLFWFSFFSSLLKKEMREKRKNKNAEICH